MGDGMEYTAEHNTCRETIKLKKNLPMSYPRSSNQFLFKVESRRVETVYKETEK